jgi:membrane protein
MGRLFSAFREAGVRFSRDGCAFLAQALAFNALFAFFPLAVLVVTAASYVFPVGGDRVYAFVDTLNPVLSQFVQANLATYVYGRGVSSIIALGFLIWSGKNLFMGLAYALDRALGVPKGRPIVHDIALSIVMLPVIGVLLIVAMALPVMLSVGVAFASIPDGSHVVQIGGYAVSLALVFLVTMTLYTFLPNRRLSWHFGAPGATVVACAWPIVQFAFAQYTLHVNFAHIYGALSAPLALLLWFYLVGSIFLFGAEFCAAWASRHGTERVPALIDVLDTVVDHEVAASHAAPHREPSRT